MSLETILLIGVLTILAIAFGADCLWSLVIRSCLLNTSDLPRETDTNRFFEMIVNAQRQTNQFLLVILLVILAGAIALRDKGKSMKDKELMTIKFLFGITIILANLTMIPLALAETVEVSGGGKCEGDITADNLNGKVVCTYSNGDRYEGQFVDGKKQGQG